MIDSYRLRMATMGGYEGEARRRNSQKIMDASWMRDPATKPVYVKWVDSGVPVVDDDDEMLYAKYNMTLDANEPTAPIIIPSITKGHLINQSVAPTNFIIPTSLLLEYTVSLIVFIIRNTDTPTNTINNPIPTI